MPLLRLGFEGDALILMSVGVENARSIIGSVMDPAELVRGSERYLY